jgi:hypothetical protein
MNLALWEGFKMIALSGLPDDPQEVPVVLIVDSPWLPGFMGIPNREVLADGTLEEVRIYAAKCIRKTEGKGTHPFGRWRRSSRRAGRKHRCPG